MIRTARELNLGRDTTRIKDPRDAQRQHATVDAILERFFAPVARDRREVQMLADEVGMGKTFVALAVAHAILAAQRRGEGGDLEGCYQKVLVITPQNSALFRKWRREVEEFVRRCFAEADRGAMQNWFAPAVAERIDDVVRQLRRGGGGPSVVITHTGVFSGGKFRDYALKRRLVLGQLFRLWGVRLRKEERELLLKGAPTDWPKDPSRIDDFTVDELDQLPMSADEAYSALVRLADPDWRSGDGRIERLLTLCKDIGTPYVRDRSEQFRQVGADLAAVYRMICEEMIRSDVPLVIVDEAHNWKNGPSANANGYHGFRRLIAARTRRVLLLTATPFQLRPEEMLQVLDVAGHIKPAPTIEESRRRTESLTQLRDRRIAPVLANSSATSRRFQKAWARLPRTVTPEQLREIWASAALEKGRASLAELVGREGSSDTKRIDQRVEQAIAGVDPDCRQLMREALRLHAYNQDLSQQLGTFVIRHRRGTDHRLFRVGAEYDAELASVAARPDAHLLHLAPGIDVRGDGELPQYLLMRCVSEMKEGRGRSSLGSALTGCYSTLLESAEGRQVTSLLKPSTTGGMYLGLLREMVDAKQDPKHPKLEEVVDRAVEAWRAGEKTLIFCFRVNTARRLHDIITERIQQELRTRRRRLLGKEGALKALKSRLSARDRDLVGLGLDRPLLSFLWVSPFGKVPAPYTAEDLLLRDDELDALARLALERGVDLAGERVDRVFVFRATEHLVAQRVLPRVSHLGWRRLLQQVASPAWVDYPYGGEEPDLSVETAKHEEAPATDERGVSRVYEPTRNPSDDAVERLARDLRTRRKRARQQGVAILDGYGESPSLWFGRGPRTLLGSQDGRGEPSAELQSLFELNRHLAQLSQTNGELDWAGRRVVIEAMRRTVFRDSVLLRLLPSKHQREESGWGELLAERFFAPMPGQHESMADRIAVFLEDLAGMSGSVLEEGSSRHTLIDATHLRDQQFVALVTGGGGKAQSRERVFAGFNTPLLPEVLICTSVGQEGIDLHRHCRMVVHYDLAWNPAVLEQRTGRVDRIGSKTFRERARAEEGAKPYLEVGVPFLAGTYDERMYEELRLRAQTFEVLTGGDFAVDNAEGSDDRSVAERHGAEMSVVPLPEEMVHELRVKLNVWPARSPSR